MDENKLDVASTHFVTVFEGNPAEAQVLQTVLQGQGFNVLVANHTIKSVDPFITGPGMFDMTLQVPEGQATEAMAALKDARTERTSDSPDTEASSETALWDGETAGRRLRWGSVVVGFLLLVPPVAESY